MEKWQEQIKEILFDAEAKGLAQDLLLWSEGISAIDSNTEELLGSILRDVYEELPPPRAMWVAFMLGAAWQTSQTGRRGAS
jgi:hypothetical protein